MERLFEEAEVKKVVWSIEDDKASSPDGFSMAFFKSCWDVIKRDFYSKKPGNLLTFFLFTFFNLSDTS